MNNFSSKRFPKIQKFVSLVLAVLFVFSSNNYIAYGKTSNQIEVLSIEASGHDGNVAENAIDGAYETRWSASGEGQYVILSLPKDTDISYFGLSFYKGDERSTKFEINVSSDGKTYEQVYTGEASGKTTELELVDIKDVKASFVKIVFNGNSANKWNSVTEIQVYGPKEGELTLSKVEPLVTETKKDVKYTAPGFVNPDLTKHTVHTPNAVTGKTINVADYNADLTDSKNNDLDAIKNAIKDAKAGDEVYLPNGVYNLTTKDTYTVLLKSGVNVRGESKEDTIIICNSADGKTYPDSIFKSLGQNNIKISDLTFTSDFKGDYTTDPNSNNSVFSPKYMIQIEDDSLAKPSFNITIDNVLFENFRTQAVRISKSRDCVVKNSTFRNATDVGAGGAGYAVAIQGEGWEKDRLGFENDSRYNLVENCSFEGPYLRHGVLIQYYSHNNLVRNNKFDANVLDAIDLHGEDEYLNEITGNTLTNIVTGGAIGVGNTGATHDKAGEGNYIHGNTIINCREGIKVYQGSSGTIIENNTITNDSVKDAKGIYLIGAPNTVVKDNKIVGNTAEGFVAIQLSEEKLKEGVGQPDGTIITGNTATGNTSGLVIDAGTNLTITNNVIENNKADIVDNRADVDRKDDKTDVKAPTTGVITKPITNGIVSNAAELTAALDYAKPGDTITLKNGVWKDQQLVVDVDGTKENPITIKAETQGQVILTGNSDLKIGGDYVIVDGLYFKDGSLDGKSGAVIEFRNGSSNVANNSVLRNTIIADYNSENKETDYKWVSLYGTYNTVENCDFRGKNHKGSLLVVWRDDDSAQYHTIRYNRFSYIQEFGDNGAETIRVGTSTNSLSDSYTTVEYNIFDQCNGETEIISNKSGHNTYRGNLFINSKGTLTLRHGDNCLVEGNFFFGGNYPGTGGIRVIGENHTVTNNYIQDVKGDSGSFKSALNVTNGVPDSPLTRYFQVKNAKITNNVLINNSANIYVGSGKSDELSLAPEKITIKDNIIVLNEPNDEVIKYIDQPTNSIIENNKVVNTSDLQYIESNGYGIYVPKGFEPRPVDSKLVGPTGVTAVTLPVRNLYKEETDVKVKLPYEFEDNTVLFGIGSDVVYVENTKSTIDITENTVVPFVSNKKAYIPMRFIFETYGYDVSYDGKTKSVIATKNDNVIKFDLNKGVYTVNNGTSKSSDVTNVRGKSYISLGNIEEALNVKSIFDTRGFVVISSSEKIINQFNNEDLANSILSLYRVTASNHDGNIPLNTIDGDLATRWSSEGENEWIKYDLFETKNINEVQVAFFKGNERTTTFDIAVSTDDVNYTTVYSGKSNGTTSDLESFKFANKDVRYVKLITKGNSVNKWNSISEVKVITSTGEEAFNSIAFKLDEVDGSEGTTSPTGNIGNAVIPENAVAILPTDDTYIELGASADKNFGGENRLRAKANEGNTVNRVSYIKYDLSQFKNISEAYFQISSKMSANNPEGSTFTVDFYSVDNKDWSENDLTFNTAFGITPDGIEVTGVGTTTFLINSVTMSGAEETKTYNVDFTEYLSKSDADFITIMMVDTRKENINMDFYSKERSTENLRPYLYIVE